MSETTTTTGARALPRRMHFPYARRVARRGYAIRWAGWSDKWWRLIGGLWWVIDGGTKRIAGSSDMTEELMLGWNWTTQAAGCDTTAVELTAEEMAELLRVRPFQGLATAGDPLGMGCALPVLDVLAGPRFAAVSFPGMPTVEDLVEGVTFGEIEDPLLLPDGNPRAEWKPTGARKLIPPAGGGSTPTLAVTFSVTNRIPDITTGAGCINGAPGATTVRCDITSGFIKFTGGLAGAQYTVEVRVYGYGIASGGTALFIGPSLGTTITVDAEELTAWGPGAGVTPGILLTPNQTYTVKAIWSRVGGGASGESSAVSVTVPPFCASGSGE